MNSKIVFLLNKSLEFLRNSNLDSAELYLKKALKLQSNNPHVLRLLGVVFAKRKQYSEAIKFFKESLQVFPRNALTLSNIGNIFYETKDYESALGAYDKSIKIEPNYYEAWSNKGNVLQELRRYNEALSCYDKALALRPDYAEAWSNKGNTMHQLRKFDEALSCYDKALALRPDYAEAWSNKGYSLLELKRYVEAIAYYEKALSLQSEIDWVYGEVLHTKMKVCSLNFFDEHVKEISRWVSSGQKIIQPFALLSLIDDPILHQKASEIYVNELYPSKTSKLSLIRYPKRQKIRIGYFSADFNENPTAHLAAELFELHDRNQFELIAFSYGPNDNSQIRLQVSKSFDEFIDVQKMSDEAIARLSIAKEIDIAVNLGAAFAAGSRVGIFSYRAAPIQVNYFTTSTLGASYVDYIVSDKILIPDASKSFYREKVIYLPNSVMVDDSRRIASNRIFSKKECGLPENYFIFCSFNNHYKYNPHVLNLWAKILSQVGQSVLWIPYHNEQFSKNIAAEFESRGINRDRLVFATQLELMADHLARYALADLFLDCYPYSAQTTALDSLKTGVPLLTLQGKSLCSRMASSILSAIDLPELITTSEEEYERLAVNLASNPAKLANIKQKVLDNRFTTTLFNTRLYTKHIEVAYKKIMERHWSGLPIDHINIQ